MNSSAAIRDSGLPLGEGLRIEARLFNQLIGSSEMIEGLRRFNQRDHPDRRHDTTPTTAGIARPHAASPAPEPPR